MKPPAPPNFPRDHKTGHSSAVLSFCGRLGERKCEILFLTKIGLARWRVETIRLIAFALVAATTPAFAVETLPWARKLKALTDGGARIITLRMTRDSIEIVHDRGPDRTRRKL
jgi:hypothetical protein